MSITYSMHRFIWLAAFCLFPASALRATALRVQAPAPLALGDTAALTVEVDSVQDLFGFQFDLHFNPAVIHVASVSEGAFLAAAGGTFFSPGTIDNGAGTVTIIANVLSGPVAGVDGSGTLVRFDLLTMAEGTSDVWITDAQLLNSTLDPISFYTQADVVSVSAPEPSAFIPCAMMAAAWIVAKRRRSPKR
jgi:hypothetical protein